MYIVSDVNSKFENLIKQLKTSDDLTSTVWVFLTTLILSNRLKHMTTDLGTDGWRQIYQSGVGEQFDI